ncbi:MAG TPA: aminotransferase class I/II-fold pyridoxal phosphate-dependent enzyme [Terriglobales bacterium]|nr:aminotransferase class I/II-fold pyridoxal phosphate-dependent enzyme [Terriglobales bacterium]
MNSGHIETKVIHAGEPEPRIMGAVNMPIFQSAMFEYAGETSYHDLKYIRLNNTPNQAALSAKLSALENAEAALVTSSGMAAITTTLLSILTPGGHLLAQNCLYGGTHDFVTRDLDQLGMAYDFIDANQPDTWERKLRANTRAIYVETMTNPLLEVADHKAVVQFAKTHGLISLIDNTFATPVNFRPPEFGYDISLHSCTKYLNGHSDIVAGAIIGKASHIENVKHHLDHLGGSLDPHACYLLHRGMKTLAVRVRFQNESALKIAKFLNDHDAVEKVNYPGLESHPQHARAAELFEGFGGMLSFEVRGDARAAEKFLKSTKLPVIAPSLGGVETLLTLPAQTSHAGMSPKDRNALGITDGLIRMSVGIENTEDIVNDLNTALQQI